MRPEINQKIEELAELLEEDQENPLETDREPVFDEEIYELTIELRDIAENGTLDDKTEWSKKKQAYVKEHNKPLDLTRIDLSGHDLSHLDLSGIILGQADFSQANLEWANLSGSKCMLADFSGANLHLANLKNILAVNAKFIDATLTGTRGRSGFYHYADFSNAEIQADFSYSLFYRTTFTDAYIEETNFGYAYFDDRERQLTEADIDSAILALDRSDLEKLYPS